MGYQIKHNNFRKNQIESKEEEAVENVIYSDEESTEVLSLSHALGGILIFEFLMIASICSP
jgi:hypothetical protein